jgi:hypothetical protein
VSEPANSMPSLYYTLCACAYRKDHLLTQHADTWELMPVNVYPTLGI